MCENPTKTATWEKWEEWDEEVGVGIGVIGTLILIVLQTFLKRLCHNHRTQEGQTPDL